MSLARRAIDVEHNAQLCFAYADLACRAADVERFLFVDRSEWTTFRFNLRNFCWKQVLQEEVEKGNVPEDITVRRVPSTTFDSEFASQPVSGSADPSLATSAATTTSKVKKRPKFKVLP